MWPVAPRDKLFKPRRPQHEKGEITEVCTGWNVARSVGKVAIVLARERIGDAKGPALDLKGSE